MNQTVFMQTMLLLGFLVLLLDLVVMMVIHRSPLDGPRKYFWFLIVLLLPVIGLLLWIVLGPRSYAQRKAGNSVVVSDKHRADDDAQVFTTIAPDNNSGEPRR